jgi:hypothetical protein
MGGDLPDTVKAFQEGSEEAKGVRRRFCDYRSERIDAAVTSDMQRAFHRYTLRVKWRRQLLEQEFAPASQRSDEMPGVSVINTMYSLACR